MTWWRSIVWAWSTTWCCTDCSFRVDTPTTPRSKVSVCHTATILNDGLLSEKHVRVLAKIIYLIVSNIFLRTYLVMKIKAKMYVNIVRIKGICTHACVCICVYFEKRDLYFWLVGV